jgi:7-cyano-7-deazaguanine reductase
MVGVLGQSVAAPSVYTPAILERIARVSQGEHAGFGWDVWHCYELSWSVKGTVGSWVGVLGIPADSPATVESKSLKLYLNSLNHHDFDSVPHAISVITEDVSQCVGAMVVLNLLPVTDLSGITTELTGVNIPACPLGVEVGIITQEQLSMSPRKGNVVSEQLISHSLRSLCPVTSQPDWGSLFIEYTGQQIDHDSVARYLSGYREHQGFHEQCLEQIFSDLMALSIDKLVVAAFYQRRGGIDITPWRSSEPLSMSPQRLGRQ